MKFQINDIVQITDPEHYWFPCLVVVTEPKSWGVQGYVMIPHNDGTPTGQAYIRPRNEQIEYVGKAIVVDRDSTVEET
jgi:hypothetical protein